MIHLDIDRAVFGNQLMLITDRLRQLLDVVSEERKVLIEMQAVADVYGALVQMLISCEVQDPSHVD